MGFKEILARRLTSLVLILFVVGTIWGANGRPMFGPEPSADCLTWQEKVQKEGRSYRGGTEEGALRGAIRTYAGSKPDGCPIPTHL